MVSGEETLAGKLSTSFFAGRQQTVLMAPAVLPMSNRHLNRGYAMELKIYPDKVLRKRCKPLRDVGDAEAQRMRDMLEFMYEADGVGLAGPQVGWSARVIALDPEQDQSGPRIFINPRLLESEGNAVEPEGCLSLPGIQAPVSRSERVRVAAYTLSGDRIEEESEGLRARAWQHEIDHLNGVLFIDRLEPTALVQIRRRLKELEESRETQTARSV